MKFLARKKNSTPLLVFRLAAQTVPAYQKLLARLNINPLKIRTLKDFQNLPITDKKSYILANPPQDIFPQRKIPAMAYASSGSSGLPTFWFRDEEQEKIGGKIHEKIFNKIFHIKKDERTLVVVCFAMGVWIAGNYTLASSRFVTKKGYSLTTVTPGIEQEDILRVLEGLAPDFQNLVLAGYPPFLMNVVAEAVKRKNFPKTKTFILTAGDKFSEKWRDEIINLLAVKNPYNSVISIYGSADAGILGHETPLSIFLRKKALENKNFSKKLFRDYNYIDMPALVQYSPKNIFFEQINNELVLTTTNTAAPLIRYNIHDLGRIISWGEAKNLLKQHRLEREAEKFGLAEWQLPFLVLGGRTDVAATFYAINIFPEHIRAGIEKRKLLKFLSGTFFLYNKTVGKSRKQELHIELGLNPSISPSKKLQNLCRQSILGALLKCNTEFRKLYSVMGSRVLPKINLHLHGAPFFQRKIRKKGLVSIKGKKPKIT